MTVKDLVVTGIAKILRSLNVDTLVVEKINEANKDEINALKGVTSNIQQQINSANTTVSNATTAQDNWKSQIANAINGIPKPSASNVSSSSALSSYVAEANKVKTAISGATAEIDNVLAGKKYVNKNGQLATGTMPEQGEYTDTTGYKAYRDGKMYVGIPKGSYMKSTVSGVPEIMIPYSDITSLFGVTAAKILKGNTIFGIAGTATDDADATASDMLSGKTAWVKGTKVVGAIPTIPDWYCPKYGLSDIGDLIRYCPRGEVNTYYDESGNSHPTDGRPFIWILYNRTGYIDGVRDRIIMEAKHFGNAYPDYVMEGVTFTSANGLKLTGTLKEIPDYFYFPDAPLNFRKGRTSYGAIDGTTKSIEATNFISVYYMNTDTDADGNDIEYPGFYVSEGSNREHMILASRFGDADTTDVRKNKTFTSNNGLKIAGTMNEIKDYFYHPNATLQMSTRTSYTDDNGATQNIASTKFLTVYAGTTGYMTSTSNEIMIKADRLGNASASDVVSGKTFTSENGLKITGTMSPNSGIIYRSTACLYSAAPPMAQASWDDVACGSIDVCPDPDHNISDIVAIAVYFTGHVKLFSTTVDSTDGPTGGMIITDGSTTVEPVGVAVIQPDGWGILSSDVQVSTDWSQYNITIYLEASHWDYIGPEIDTKLNVIALYK